MLDLCSVNLTESVTRIVQNKRRRGKAIETTVTTTTTMTNTMTGAVTPANNSNRNASSSNTKKTGKKSAPKNSIETNNTAKVAAKAPAKTRSHNARKQALFPQKSTNESTAISSEFHTNLIDSKQWPTLKKDKPATASVGGGGGAAAAAAAAQKKDSKAKPEIDKKSNESPKKSNDEAKVHGSWSFVLGAKAGPVESESVVDNPIESVNDSISPANGIVASVESVDPPVISSDRIVESVETTVAQKNTTTKKTRFEQGPYHFTVYKKGVKYFDNYSQSVNYDDDQVCGQIIATKLYNQCDGNGNFVQEMVYSIASQNPNIYYNFNGTMKSLRVHLCLVIQSLFDSTNLRFDNFLKHYTDVNGSVPIQIIASHRTVQKLTNDINLVVSAISLSTRLVIDMDSFSVRRVEWTTFDQDMVTEPDNDYDRPDDSLYRYCPVPLLHPQELIGSLPRR